MTGHYQVAPCSIEGPLNVSPSTLSSRIDPESSTVNLNSQLAYRMQTITS